MRNGFEYFEGVPKKVIFDNARVAVSEGFGKTAKKTERYGRMAAHYVSKPTFCNIAEGHEKGLVENLVGLCRRNALTPVPRVNNIDELNNTLRMYCDNYNERHKVDSRSDKVGVLLAESKRMFTKLPPYRYDTAKIQSVKVNNFSLVKVDYNKYSVPFQYSGKDITVKSYGRRIDFVVSNEVVASYNRDFKRGNVHYRLEHYLELIERNPRSVFNAAPVKNSVPEELYSYLLKQEDPKTVIEVLKMYICNKERVMVAVCHGIPFNQITNPNMSEEHNNTRPVKPEITVIVNSAVLSQYDKLIGSC